MAVYDTFAEYYDRFFAPLESLGLRKFRKEATSLLPIGASIVELGAGTGANFEFYPLSRIAVSTELSIEMMRKAKAKRRSNLLVNADAQHMPFAENEFDAAFATLVFCSIPRTELAFAELRRILKPGGMVVLLEHVRPNGLLGYAFDLLNSVTSRVFEDHFNRNTARDAEAAGLHVLEVRKKLFGIVNLIVCRV